MQEKQLTTLLEKGDLRQSINSLQSFHKLSIIPEQLLPVTDDFGEQVIHQLKRCSNIKEVYDLGVQLGYEGYASDELLNCLSRCIITKEDNERKKAIMLETLSKAEESLLLGATELPIIEVLTSIYYITHLQL